jgi:hypothetical protein
MAGYSGTPLATKLGIKSGTRILEINAPKEYGDWLGTLPEGARFVARAPKAGSDLVHLFVASMAELVRELPRARAAIAPDGAIWVSWYKKSAKMPTDVTEDLIRARALKTDLVDVKVCAVTDVWSGLKLVVRKHLR